MFLGQKINAAFAAANMLLRFDHTYDLDYARRVYPFLIEVAGFWEAYLRLENGRYLITKDASGEVGDGGSDQNNCLSLGLVRMFFQGLLEVLRNDVRGWPEPEWIGHFNGFSLTFPGAVRVGHDPRDILARLRKQLTVSGFPNLMVVGGGGGIENCSGVPATINEMLLQTHGGVMRLFPV